MGPCRFHKADPSRAPAHQQTYANILATNTLNIKSSKHEKCSTPRHDRHTLASYQKLHQQKTVTTNMYATKNGWPRATKKH